MERLRRSVCLTFFMALAGCTRTSDPPSFEKATTDLASQPISESTQKKSARGTPRLALEFLAAEQDRFHRTIPISDDYDSGGNHFFPCGWVEDLATPDQFPERKILDANCEDDPQAGSSCIRISYVPQPQEGHSGVAGITWLPPNAEFGRHRGYDFSRYRVAGEKLSVGFFARAREPDVYAQFRIGGVNRAPFGSPELPFQDSLQLTPWDTTAIKLAPEWLPYSIDLPPDADLSNWTGGFTWETTLAYNPQGCTLEIDEIHLQLGPKGSELRLSEPRLIRSYIPRNTMKARSIAYIYDSAVCLMAFLAAARYDGDHSDDYLRRSKLLADAFVICQKRDRSFGDGRLRNAYSCGDLLDTNGVSRLPGWWDPENEIYLEDENFASTDAGNCAWVMLALLSYAEVASAEDRFQYVSAARRLGEWIVSHCYRSDGPGGFSGGVDGWEAAENNLNGQRRILWRSTEHNLDLAAAFERLGSSLVRYQIAGADEYARWHQAAKHAEKFVHAMWNPDAGHFWTGMTPNNVINTSTIPLDVQTWGLMAMRDRRYERGMEWVLKHCRVDRCPVDNVSSGFDFNGETKPDGVWFEGTAQVVLALRLVGRDQEADRVLDELRQAASRVEPRGALFAASRDGLSTGFTKSSADGTPFSWVYFRTQAIAPVSWRVLAEMNWNPFWNEEIKELPQ